MCRLFGLTAAPHRTKATFWLLDASDSLTAQSHRDPDGAGLGFFCRRRGPHPQGPDRRLRGPLFRRGGQAGDLDDASSPTCATPRRVAWSGRTPTRSSRTTACSRTTAWSRARPAGGGARPRPEPGQGRHRLRTRLRPHHPGRSAPTAATLSAAIASATRWIAAELPLYALNIILVSASQLWALRYPETHELYVLERRPGRLLHEGTGGRIRVQCSGLAKLKCLVVARVSEWTTIPAGVLMEPGELLHVDGRSAVHRKSDSARPAPAPDDPRGSAARGGGVAAHRLNGFVPGDAVVVHPGKGAAFGHLPQHHRQEEVAEIGPDGPGAFPSPLRLPCATIRSTRARRSRS